MKCQACGESFKRAMLLALLIDAGAKTSDPNYCPDTEDNQHQWIEADAAKEARG